MNSSSFQRTRAIMRSAYRTLRRNPRLLWFPVLTATMVLIAVIALGFLAARPEVLGPATVALRVRVVMGLALAFVVNAVAILGAIALTHAALEALGGRSFTVSGSMRHAWSRAPAAATYAVIRATVGHLLGRGQRKRKRRLLTRLADMAWSTAVYLVIPVITREGKGGFAAIGRSIELMKQTWREAFLGHLALGWFWIPFFLVALIPVALLAIFGVDDGRLVVLAIATPVVLTAAAALFIGTLETIYRTALYVYATEGVVPEPFDVPDLHEVWHVSAS